MSNPENSYAVRPGHTNTPTAKAIRYVEDKAVDMYLVEELLSQSASVNQWSNFGPLSKHLETTLAQYLQLGDDLRIVACCNATIALHTLVAMHQVLTKKNLRWSCSAFGFYSSTNGNLADATIVDCDTNAMLDLNLLDHKQLDGLVVTNVFGHTRSLDQYQSYAQAHHKILIIDSAMAFHTGGHGPNEVISFHHTKPWGFGEGGCAIIHKDHEQLFRNMISFGHKSPESPIHRQATNGKISDIACAFILMRLQQMASLSEQYIQQYQRIAKLGKDEGLSLLGDAFKHPGIPASVPLLMPKAIYDVEFYNIPIKKYYFPLAERPQARAIYDRIVNIPCHPEMNFYDDDQLRRLFRSLLTKV